MRRTSSLVVLLLLPVIGLTAPVGARSVPMAGDPAMVWTREHAWSGDVGGQDVAIGADAIFIVGDETVAFDRETGDLLWQAPGGTEVLADLSGGLVFVSDATGWDPWFPSPCDSTTSAYDAATGELVWEVPMGGALAMEGRRVFIAFANPYCWGGVVAVRSSNGQEVWHRSVSGVTWIRDVAAVNHRVSVVGGSFFDVDICEDLGKSAGSAWAMQLRRSSGEVAWRWSDGRVGKTVDHASTVRVSPHDGSVVIAGDWSSGVANCFDERWTAFAAKIRRDGEVMWIRHARFGNERYATQPDVPEDDLLAVGNRGRIYQVGIIDRNEDEEGHHLVLMKRRPDSGAPVWQRRIPDLGVFPSQGGVLVADGNVFVAGSFRPQTSFIRAFSEVNGEAFWADDRPGEWFVAWSLRIGGSNLALLTSTEGDPNPDLGHVYIFET